MTLEEFKSKVAELQDSNKIGNNPELRREFYILFDDIYLLLEQKEWERENLIEHGEPNPEAHFQDVAEAYYRLGFFEMVFFNYSKLIYDLWYRKVLAYQETHEERLHKGMQVHQIAIIYDLLNKKSEVWDYYLAGLIEDTVSERPLGSSQAFRMLRVLGMSRSELEGIHAQIKEENETIFDPLAYVLKLRREFNVSTYEENQAIDSNKLKQAEILWNKLLSQKERLKNGKQG